MSIREIDLVKSQHFIWSSSTTERFAVRSHPQSTQPIRSIFWLSDRWLFSYWKLKFSILPWKYRINEIYGSYEISLGL